MIEKSYYYQKLKENSAIILWSLIISVFFLLISYPGIFYSDSYGRIDTADKVRVALNMLLAGQRGEIERIECWVTVIPSVFMAICRMITGNIATYTLIQCFSFFWYLFY